MGLGGFAGGVTRVDILAPSKRRVRLLKPRHPLAHHVHGWYEEGADGYQWLPVERPGDPQFTVKGGVDQLDQDSYYFLRYYCLCKQRQCYLF